MEWLSMCWTKILAKITGKPQPMRPYPKGDKMENYSKFRLAKEDVDTIVGVFGSTNIFRMACLFVVAGYRIGLNPLPHLRKKFNQNFKYYENDLSVEKGGEGFYFSKDGRFLFLKSDKESYLFWQSIRFLPKN